MSQIVWNKKKLVKKNYESVAMGYCLYLSLSLILLCVYTKTYANDVNSGKAVGGSVV